jgi:hypothetical protein
VFTIGADPEVFISRDGRIVSAIGMIGGTKDEPKRVSDRICVQEDNVLAEFNIPPATSPKDFVMFISEGLSEIKKIIKQDHCDIAIIASHIMDESELTHPKALEFGCEPDENAWTLTTNIPPEVSTKLRSAGGHVHVGGVKEEKAIHTVRAMDLFLGIPSVILDRDNQRRQLYGKAGCFRFKEYGIEYRTLSNFWLSDPRLADWVYKSTQKAAQWAAENEIIYSDSELGKNIVKAINGADVNLAARILEENHMVEMPEVSCG